MTRLGGRRSRVDAAQRRTEALELALGGTPQAEIAARLGYPNTSAVTKDLELACDQVHERLEEVARRYVVMMLQRADRGAAQFFRLMSDEDLTVFERCSAAVTMTKLQEQAMKLLGIGPYVPKHEVEQRRHVTVEHVTVRGADGSMTQVAVPAVTPASAQRELVMRLLEQASAGIEPGEQGERAAVQAAVEVEVEREG